MNSIPEPWATAIVAAGYKDPRFDEPTPSLRALGEAAHLHTTTVSRMVQGKGVAKVENVAAVAEALGVDVRSVSEWVRQARAEVEPYVPPAEADLLTRRERDALTELIRAVTESRRAGDVQAPMKQAPVSGATGVSTAGAPAGDAGDAAAGFGGRAGNEPTPPGIEWTEPRPRKPRTRGRTAPRHMDGGTNGGQGTGDRR